MRTYPGIRVGLFKDPKERQQVKVIDDMLRQVSGALSKSVFPGQQPPANPIPVTPPPGGGTPAVPTPTQGDLLYGLLTGTWTKLAIGTNGYLLTVVGGAPAWQPAPSTGAPTTATYITQTADGTLSNEQNLDALATGLMKNTTGTGVISIAAAADLPTHGAAQHTDRTRTLFIPAQTWVSAVPAIEAGTFPNSYPAIVMPDGAVPDTIIACIVIPQDFVAGGTTAWKIHYVNTGVSTNGVHWDLYYKIVSDEEVITGANDVTMSGNSTPTNVADTLDIFTVGTTVTSIQPGDLVKLSLQRDPTDGGDTNAADMDFIGLQLDYTADM